MSKVLPFGRMGGALPPESPRKIYYELQDNALSVGGLHPRQGDLCCIAEGVEIVGRPHMARTRGGQLLCGILKLSGRKNRLVTLEFLNPDFPPFTRHRDQLDILGVVERFYCAAAGDLSSGLYLAPASPTGEGVNQVQVERSVPPLHIGEGLDDVPVERIVNWRADATGTIELLSPNWHEITGKTPEYLRDLGYINLLRPAERAAVRTQWLNSLETGEPFAFQRQLKTRRGYRLARCLAVRVKSPLTGLPVWVGTLHFMEEI